MGSVVRVGDLRVGGLGSGWARVWSWVWGLRGGLVGVGVLHENDDANVTPKRQRPFRLRRARPLNQPIPSVGFQALAAVDESGNSSVASSSESDSDTIKSDGSDYLDGIRVQVSKYACICFPSFFSAPQSPHRSDRLSFLFLSPQHRKL